MIKKRYRYQLIIDDLPNVTMERNEDGDLEPNFKEGIYVGDYDHVNDITLIYNHLDITVKVHHVVGGDEVRIVGFEVEQKSINRNGSLNPELYSE